MNSDPTKSTNDLVDLSVKVPGSTGGINGDGGSPAAGADPDSDPTRDLSTTTQSVTVDRELVTVPLAEWTRLNDLVTELRTTAESRGRVIDRFKSQYRSAPKTFDQDIRNFLNTHR